MEVRCEVMHYLCHVLMVEVMHSRTHVQREAFGAREPWAGSSVDSDHEDACFDRATLKQTCLNWCVGANPRDAP